MKLFGITAFAALVLSTPVYAEDPAVGIASMEAALVQAVNPLAQTKLDVATEFDCSDTASENCDAFDAANAQYIAAILKATEALTLMEIAVRR